MIPYLYTAADVQSHLADWAGFTGAASVELQRKIKRSIDNAYRALTNIRDWTYYIYRGRINTNAMYQTGTIAYTNSTRTVTLTGGTLPANTNLCIFRVGPVDYQVVNGSANIGAGTFQLSINSNPNQDIAAGTTYTLYQDMYVLPVNFQKMGMLRDCNRFRILEHVSPDEILNSRQIYQPPTMPWRYTIRSDASYMGVCGIQFYPAPDQFYQLDYMGTRYPRPFTMPVAYTTGTVTTSGTTVTGSSTAWTSKMIGTVIRFSNTTTAPSGMYGTNPFYLQRIITSFTSATQVGIDLALDAEQTGVAYEISDPIDMEAAGMYTAFLRACEFELGQLLNRDDTDRLQGQYQRALQGAMESDNRSRDVKPSGRLFGSRVSDFQPLTDS